MSNKSQLQENNVTLEYVLAQIKDMPSTEDCMALIAELTERVTPISLGGTGAKTVEEARENLGVHEWETLSSYLFTHDVPQGKDSSGSSYKITVTIPCDETILEEYSFFRFIVKQGSTYSSTINNSYNNEAPSLTVSNEYYESSVLITLKTGVPNSYSFEDDCVIAVGARPPIKNNNGNPRYSTASVLNWTFDVRATMGNSGISNGRVYTNLTLELQGMR